MNKSANSKKYKVHSLERGLDLIEILADGSPEKSLSELSKKAEFNPSTAHRILDALKSRGYVRQNPETSNYSLTYKMFEIAHRIGWARTLKDLALPVVRELAVTSRQSAFLIIVESDEALCLERIDGNPFIRVAALEKGGRMPLHMGAGPRALLANMPDPEVDRIIRIKGLPAWTAHTITNPFQLKDDLKVIRKQGYAVSTEDVTDGVGALGCPLRNTAGEVIAAISICGVAGDFTEDKLPRLLTFVTNAVQEISSLLSS